MPRSPPYPWDYTQAGPSSRFRPCNYSTLPVPSASSLTPNITRSDGRNSRINHGVHPASFGDQCRFSVPTMSQPSHEASGKSRPSPTTVMASRLSSSGQMLIYLRDAAQTDRTVAELRDQLKGPLGFDIEYRPNFIKGRPLNRTALVQLASESVTLLVQVSAMSQFPDTIKSIIEDPTIVKAGVGIQGDANKLWKDFGIDAARCLELGHLARAIDDQWSNSKGLIGLARLVKAYEDYVFEKPKHIQMSNWELFLTQEQQDYAANDATASLAVLRKLYAILPSIQPPPSETFYIF